MRAPYALSFEEEQAEAAAEQEWLDAVAYLSQPDIREQVVEYAASLVREYDAGCDEATAKDAARDVFGARKSTTIPTEST